MFLLIFGSFPTGPAVLTYTVWLILHVMSAALSCILGTKLLSTFLINQPTAAVWYISIQSLGPAVRI